MGSDLSRVISLSYISLSYISLSLCLNLHLALVSLSQISHLVLEPELRGVQYEVEICIAKKN